MKIKVVNAAVNQKPGNGKGGSNFCPWLLEYPVEPSNRG
jgi:hypothetical protein